MEEYQILLSVEHHSTKSKYPFVIMDELMVKKTCNYIDIEFVPAMQRMRDINNNKYKNNVKGGVDTISEIMFVDFT